MISATLALVTLTLAPTDRGDSTTTETRSPRILTDAVRLAGVTTVWAAISPNVRGSILDSGSVGNIVANFRSPIRRAIEGGRADHDLFTTNYVAHPLSWAVIGLYLRGRGYSRPGAFLFSQLHSMAWEYVVEGSYMKPSGKDLITNAVGAATAIYWLDGRLPSVGRIVGKEHRATVRVGSVPRSGRSTLGVTLTVSRATLGDR